MIALLTLGCNTPQDPASAPASADTTAAAKPDNSEPQALIATEVDAQVKALAGAYFVAAANNSKKVTVKLHIAEDGMAQMFLYWAEGNTTEQIPGKATFKDGVLTVGNPKVSENFTLADNGGLKYAGTRADLEGIVLTKAQK